MRNDRATLKIDAGYYYTAPVGTELPTDLLDPEAEGWEEIGHTSLEDIMGTESEGGEKTVLATLQNKSLRTTYSNRTETWTIQLQQFDTASLKLFYGSNAQTLAKHGAVTNETNAKPTEKAYLAVYIDGENVFAIWAPKTEIFRGDDFALENTEDLNSLPLAITPLQNGSNTYTYAVTPLGEFPDAVAWEATTAYSLGDEVVLTGDEVLECTVAGTSGSTEPTAPATVGGTVTDGTVTWQRVL